MINDNFLIIGLDLSLNSSGISIGYFENMNSKKLELYRVVFDDNKTVNEKQLKPIINVNQIKYKLPINISGSELIISSEDQNSKEQNEATIKAIIASEKIRKVVISAIKRYQVKNVYFAIEGFIMPSSGGQNQLKQIAGLIQIQGFVREFIIELSVSNLLNLNDTKLLIITPKENKKIFSNNGNADKDKMIETFYSKHNGEELLPNGKSKGLKIDDIIDAYSLMYSAYSKLINYSPIKEKELIPIL